MSNVYELIAGDIKLAGFSTLCVPTPEGVFAYTIGLTELGHPEIFISGLRGETCHILFLELAARIKAGQQFVAGEVEDTICNLPFAFRTMTDAGAEEYCCQALFFYERKMLKPTFLQLVITDQHGIFPWQDGYDAEHMKAQRRLWVGLN